jgi:hypothetical protein
VMVDVAVSRETFGMHAHSIKTVVISAKNGRLYIPVYSQASFIILPQRIRPDENLVPFSVAQQ